MLMFFWTMVILPLLICFGPFEFFAELLVCGSVEKMISPQLIEPLPFTTTELILWSFSVRAVIFSEIFFNKSTKV